MMYLVGASYSRPGSFTTIRRARHDHCYTLGSQEVPFGLGAFRRIAEHVGKIDSACELFGGRGWQSSIIQDICRPRKHVVYTERPSMASVRRSLPDIKVKPGDNIWRDSYLFGARDYEWVHADFNQYTHLREQKNRTNRYYRSLQGMVRTSSRYLSLTDSTCFGLARFKHVREGYGRRNGMNPDDWSDYFRVTAEYYKEHFGFGMVAVVTWLRVAAMVLLERDAPIQYELIENRDKTLVKFIGPEPPPERSKK